MHWAKTQSRARFNLATSGVGSFPLAELPRQPALEINGDSTYGYAPLQQAIARECGVDPDFVVAAADEAACRASEQTEIIRLSIEDQRRIARAILNPPAPTAALRRAAKRHRLLIDAG